ncbi:KilA-N domain-containing protein [Salmonella enterica]|nr:KilA-N domain-containing protein [Salmonella enterica]
MEAFTHAVNGDGKKDVPSRWLRSGEVIKLINEFQSKTQKRVLQTFRGNVKNRGTWAIEEIVYAYASWISAE